MRPHGNSEQLEWRRRQAIHLLKAGKSIREVAFVLKASVSSVERWKKTYSAEGMCALRSKPSYGRPPRLNSKDLLELKQILLLGSLVAGFPEEQWTLKRIGAVIEERFYFRLGPSQVRRILVGKLKWTHHKPEKKAFERREREIRRWMANDWEHIKKGQALSGAPDFLG